MSPNIGSGISILPRFGLVMFLGLIANTATAQTIQGSATYRERMALPPTAVFEAALEDVSRADAPAETIARTRIASPGNPPIAFTIAYDPAKILPDHRYVVRARILLEDKLLFASDTATPVITRGSPTSVSILLRRVGAGQTAPPLMPAPDLSKEPIGRRSSWRENQHPRGVRTARPICCFRREAACLALMGATGSWAATNGKERPSRSAGWPGPRWRASTQGRWSARFETR